VEYAEQQSHGAFIVNSPRAGNLCLHACKDEDAMLEELLVNEGGQRYIGRVYAGLERPLMNGQPLRWCFSERGHFVAEFPAIPTDTPEEVKSRLLRALARMPRQH
jgi:hypothetical protein